MMDLHLLNIDLFRKLSLAIALIRNTPSGIKPDVFTRSLAKRLFSRQHLVSIVDEHLILRQQALLARFPSSPSTITSSISLMDINGAPIDHEQCAKSSTNEYEFGAFAEKVWQIKDKKYQLKVEDIEFLLNTIGKWIITIDVESRTLPTDACLYTIQLIANQLKTDNNKPYHIVLDLLPIIDKFLDGLLDALEHTIESSTSYLHQMIVSFASSNSCIFRVLDKLCHRLLQHCESSEILDDSTHQFAPALVFMDPIDRLFRILHEIIHNRSIFQSRLSQRSIEKLYIFISQISVLLDGKSNYTHTLKLEGQLQAGNYHRTGSTMKTFRSYTSSSSSDQSQCQKHYSAKAPTSSKMPSFDYSFSQQSQYF